MLYESATGYLCDFIICTGTETLYPSPNVKLPMPFENFKNTSKVVLSLFTAFYSKCYNSASAIYAHHQSYFTHVNKMALMHMVYYQTFKPHI